MKQNKKTALMPSRLFIYYNERAIEGTVNSDCGSQIRDGIKTVVNKAYARKKNGFIPLVPVRLLVMIHQVNPFMILVQNLNRNLPKHAIRMP
jgi:hypothetical protein